MTPLLHTVTHSTSLDTLANRRFSGLKSSNSSDRIFIYFLFFNRSARRLLQILSTGLYSWGLVGSPPSASSTAPPSRGTGLLTGHVSSAGGNTRAQGVSGQGETWSCATPQGVHPRRWVSQRRGWGGWWLGSIGKKVMAVLKKIINQWWIKTQVGDLPNWQTKKS